VFLSEISELLEKGRALDQKAIVSRDGFDKGESAFVPVLSEKTFKSRIIVEGKQRCKGRELFGHSCRGGFSESDETRTCSDEEGIGVAMVAAGELEDSVATGGPSGEANRAHYCFGPGGNETDFLSSWVEGVNQLSETHFVFAGGPKAGASRRGFLNGFNDIGMGVAENQRSPRHDKIN
jgi:hypothetical protein